MAQEQNKLIRRPPFTNYLQGADKYFQTPYNVPSTFGNFYVGSSTETISDFIPQPLDFIEDKITGITDTYNTAQGLVKQEPGVLNEMVKLAPYHESYRPQILGNSLEELDKLSKQMVANPLAAQQATAKLNEIRSGIVRNPLYTTYGVTGYEDWQKRVQPAMKEKGFDTGIIGNKFYDPATGQYTQIEAVSPEVITNNWVPFFNDEISPTFKESLRQSLSTGDVFEQDGKLFSNTTKKQVGVVDPNDPVYGHYIKNAIDGVAKQILEGKGDQYRIAREVEGLDSMDKARNFVYEMISDQFYKKVTQEEGLKSHGNIPKGYGSGSEDTLPASEFDVIDYTVNENSSSSFTKQYTGNGGYEKLTQNVDALVSEVPVRTIDDVSKWASPQTVQSLRNLPDGSTVSIGGKPFTVPRTLGEDITGRNENWGKLDYNSSFNYSFVKQGNDLVPVLDVDSLNLRYTDGTPVPDNIKDEVVSALNAKQTNAHNLLNDKKIIDSRSVDVEYNSVTDTKVPLTREQYSKFEEAIGLKIDESTPSIDVLRQKIASWAAANPDEAKQVIASNPESSVAQKVTDEYYAVKTSGIRAVDVSKPKGGYYTSTTVEEIAKDQLSQQLKVGQVSMKDGELQYNEGHNPALLYNFLDNAILLDGNIPLRETEMNTVEDYNKAKAEITLGGIALDTDGKLYYMATLNTKGGDWYKKEGVLGLPWMSSGKLDGQNVKIPIDKANPAFGERLMKAIGMQEGEALFTQLMGNTISQTNQGNLPTYQNKPWIPGVKNISWQRLDEGAVDGGGDKTRIILTKNNGSTEVLEANSPGEAGKILWRYKNYQEYQKASGTGGSSMGKFKQREASPLE